MDLTERKIHKDQMSEQDKKDVTVNPGEAGLIFPAVIDEGDRHTTNARFIIAPHGKGIGAEVPSNVIFAAACSLYIQQHSDEIMQWFNEHPELMAVIFGDSVSFERIRPH